MSAYKYMTSEGGVRFLNSWSLRITPPADFNDPFELRPPAGRVFTDEYVDIQFQDAAPQMAITEIAEHLTVALGAKLTHEEIVNMATYMVKPIDATTQALFLKKLERKIPGFSSVNFLHLQKNLQTQWPLLMQQARESASTYLPRVNSIIEQGFTETLPAMLGVLCLSQNSNQPLMWAHYADSHRGLMIEFEATHPTFNRKRSIGDDFGHFRPVLYSKLRPEMSVHTLEGDNAFEVFALTKADQWSYEEEIRFIWPLKLSDRTVETPAGPIALLSCPSSSVVSVTLGCKASEQTLNEVQKGLKSQRNTEHIVVRKAKLHDTAFELSYYNV